MKPDELQKLLSQMSPDVAASFSPSKRLKQPGDDTTYFQSRGRVFMNAPLNELMSILERLVTQARSLGRDGFVPELQGMQETAREMMFELNKVVIVSGAPGSSDAAAVAAPPLPLVAAVAEPTPLAVLARKSPDLTLVVPQGTHGRVLVVDDEELDRETIAMALEAQGYAITAVGTGEQALVALRSQPFDLVLLDILLPELNGHQVLEALKSDPALSHIPVITLSGVAEMQSVIRCIELGADDYLPKPFNPVLLRARIESSMEKKLLRDKEAAFTKQLELEREKSERLLLNILPEPIAARLKAGESGIADNFPDVTVLFSDLVGFSKLSSSISASVLVDFLNEIFSAFDRLAEVHKLEKIKTIGDAYMVVGGLLTPLPEHAEAIAAMALDMRRALEEFNSGYNSSLNIRIGFHTGPVVAGIIGKNKFAYDLWGDTVNLASRMESQGFPGSIQTTATTYELIKDKFEFESRGILEVKGKGEMLTYMLTGRKHTI